METWSNANQRASVGVTVVLVGAVRVAVGDAGLSVRGPSSVSDAEVREELLVQVQRVFLWRHKHDIDQYLWLQHAKFTVTSHKKA